MSKLIRLGAVFSVGLGLAACSAGKDPGVMQLNLPQTAPGQLLVVDASTGNGDPTDPAEGMAKLLRALKKGRQAWIVIK